jgi:hypothetical protein
MKLPKLISTTRSREYNKQSEKVRDRIVYEYLFNGYTHRELDEKVIRENPDYSRGWQLMGILHYLGIRDDFKGLFKEYSIIDAIKILTESDKAQYNQIISALMRFTQNLYSDSNLELFITDVGIKKLYKKVGTSQHTDGVRIDKEFHDVFNPADSIYYTKRGTARPIKVLFNNKVFDAEYRYEGQTDEKVELQSIRFRKELKDEFKKVFPNAEGEFYIQQGIDLNHFIFAFEPVEAMLEEDDEDEYAEGKTAYKTHRCRERNQKVIKKAKDSFKKKHNGRLFCEVCKIDFSLVYGERGKNFIEGHHKKLVSEMKEGETTKVEDIAMLCSNCHRMIHRKPLLTLEQLSKLVLNNVDRTKQ